MAESKTRLPQSESVLFDAYLRILESRQLRVDVKVQIAEGHWCRWL